MTRTGSRPCPRAGDRRRRRWIAIPRPNKLDVIILSAWCNQNPEPAGGRVYCRALVLQGRAQGRLTWSM